MKKIFTLLALAGFIHLNAQVNWQQYPGAPTGGFWDMDTLNGKLYVSTGFVQEYDGSTWTTMNNYNNSSNTPNKTKSCVKAIDGKLYAGAKDFNTSGEGTIHYLSAGTWSLQQNTDFSYNGSYKIRGFAKFNSEIHACGQFQVPANPGYYQIAKWNGTDWTGLGKNFGTNPQTTEVKDIEAFQGKLYATEGSNVWAYNGTTWDSILYPPNATPSFPMSAGSISDIIVFNNELYVSGFMHLGLSNMNVLLAKYNGTSFTSVAKGETSGTVLSAGTYTSIGRMGVVGNKLYFFAKKTSDNHVYLVNYDGTSINEVSKVADYGDFTFSPGNELTMFRKVIGYNNDLVIGGTFTKVNGQTLSSIAHIPAVVGISESVKEVTLSLSPNPASNQVTIKHSLNTSVDLVITDQCGRIVSTYENIPSGDKLNLHLSKGFYFCSISTKSQVLKTTKLIIE
ncbi:MAG: hypothetical protein K0S32_2733 [Bacteroidetes bacterium]|jgi:hypothetical protein|nr:hypothetical protein [Bacteroidota bacterium]